MSFPVLEHDLPHCLYGNYTKCSTCTVQREQTPDGELVQCDGSAYWCKWHTQTGSGITFHCPNFKTYKYHCSHGGCGLRQRNEEWWTILTTEGIRPKNLPGNAVNTTVTKRVQLKQKPRRYN